MNTRYFGQLFAHISVSCSPFGVKICQNSCKQVARTYSDTHWTSKTIRNVQNMTKTFYKKTKKVNEYYILGVFVEWGVNRGSVLAMVLVVIVVVLVVAF